MGKVGRPPKQMTEEQRGKIVSMLVEDRDISPGEVMGKLGLARHDVAKRWLEEVKKDFCIGSLQIDLQNNWEEKDDGTATASAVTHEQITSLEEAVAFFDIDQDTWRVQKWVANQWGDGQKLQVKLWLERRVSAQVEDAVKILMEKVPKFKHLTHLSPTITKGGKKKMLVLSLYDHHFGKLAWAPETGDNYDLEIAEKLYIGAVQDAMLNLTPDVDEIHMAVGNDLFHFDSSRGQTASGTQMDVDSRPQKVFASGCLAVADAVAYASNYAPVHIKFVPGNHDPTWAHHLCMFLWAYFRDWSNVHVDYSPMGRKYIEYGKTMIMLIHGDLSQANMKNLPSQMAVSQPEMFARTTTREVHMGHFHHQKEMIFMPLEEHGGVIARILPSLCGTDEWHYTKGYINNQRAALALLYDYDRGYSGQHIVYADDVLGGSDG